MANITLDMTDDAGFILRLPLAYEPCRPPYKYASHPYPILIKDAYNVSVKPVDMTIKTILHRVSTEDSYSTSVKPLDITMRSILQNVYVNDPDAYSVNISPLDIKIKSIVLSYKERDDTYTVNINPLNITIDTVVIRHSVDDPDVYMPSIKPLDIILET